MILLRPKKRVRLRAPPTPTERQIFAFATGSFPTAKVPQISCLASRIRHYYDDAGRFFHPLLANRLSEQHRSKYAKKRISKI